MDENDAYIQSLITLHLGLDRLGPGDDRFSKQILSRIVDLPPHPRVADMGCGTGAGTLLLAETFQATVRAVDFSRAFLDELMTRAKRRGLDALVEPVECDMGDLDWEPGRIDLLWSEGSAYTLTFQGALAAWRPWMSTNGVAVISELTYFQDEIAAPVRDYWEKAYPAIATETENHQRATSAGFAVQGTYRLPSEAWWQNYYRPLQEKMKPLQHSSDGVMKAVIQEMEEEMELFERYGDQYGYSFYMLKVAT